MSRTGVAVGGAAIELEVPLSLPLLLLPAKSCLVCLVTLHLARLSRPPRPPPPPQRAGSKAGASPVGGATRFALVLRRRGGLEKRPRDKRSFSVGCWTLHSTLLPIPVGVPCLPSNLPTTSNPRTLFRTSSSKELQKRKRERRPKKILPPVPRHPLFHLVLFEAEAASMMFDR